jgi:dGTPase
VARSDRRHAVVATPDPRASGARDRDRILYSEPFRRLIGVTQVVGAHEGTVFHNRLTHSIKVGQIARRLAEKTLAEHAVAGTDDILKALGGLDPEVAEAAGLAHDIGHPPFGHAGEVVLDNLTRERGCDEGFEGNAQSFRIITKIAFRKVDPDDPPGLDLSRATLRATLKYPWFRELDANQQPIPNNKRSRKWSAYRTEVDDFNFAMALEPPPPQTRSLEAEIMDWADDITYAVHDMEDFYRAGLIPLPTLAQDTEAREAFIAAAAARGDLDPAKAADAFNDIRLLLPSTPFNGASTQIGELSVLRSQLIETLVNAFHVRTDDGGTVEIAAEERTVAEVLKQLTWTYVITSPDLESQQFGHKRVITELFEAFCEIDENKKTKDKDQYLRTPFLDRNSFDDCHAARRAADYIVSLTEAQALQLHGRLTGHEPGSVRDLVV